MDQILENLLLANMKGSFMILKLNKFWPILKNVFVPLSLKTIRNNRISPQNGPIKKIFIYRRPTLYPLEIAVDFLKSL